MISWETFWDSVKLAWDSTFVDALGPRDVLKTKPKSNTEHFFVYALTFIIGFIQAGLSKMQGLFKDF